MLIYKFRQKHKGNQDARGDKYPLIPIFVENLEFYNKDGKRIQIDSQKNLSDNGITDSSFYIRFWNGKLWDQMKKNWNCLNK